MLVTLVIDNTKGRNERHTCARNRLLRSVAQEEGGRNSNLIMPHARELFPGAKKQNPFHIPFPAILHQRATCQCCKCPVYAPRSNPLSQRSKGIPTHNSIVKLLQWFILFQLSDSPGPPQTSVRSFKACPAQLRFISLTRASPSLSRSQQFSHREADSRHEQCTVCAPAPIH